MCFPALGLRPQRRKPKWSVGMLPKSTCSIATYKQGTPQDDNKLSSRFGNPAWNPLQNHMQSPFRFHLLQGIRQNIWICKVFPSSGDPAQWRNPKRSIGLFPKSARPIAVYRQSIPWDYNQSSSRFGNPERNPLKNHDRSPFRFRL